MSVSSPCLVLAAPAQAAWKEASSDNFIVYSDGSETELVNFTQRVERFDRVLRIMTGLQQPPAPVKVRIYLVDNDSVVREMDFRHRAGRGILCIPGGWRHCGRRSGKASQ